MPPAPAAAPHVSAFHHRDTGTWTYLVADPATRAAAIVDPVLDFDPRSGRTGLDSVAPLLERAAADGLRIDWLLETHAHADHLSAAHALRERLRAADGRAPRLAIGRRIGEVRRVFAPLFGLSDEEPAQQPAAFDHLFDDDEGFAVGALPARAIPVPGHTQDSLAYLIGDALFAGDSLFMPDSGTARCDFPGGDAAMLYQSIQRLYLLPEATRVFVCHDYGKDGREPACETTIGAQKQGNLHVRADTDEAGFVALREARDRTLAVPALILPSLQVNLRGGALPEPEANGVRYLKLPLDQL
ncbi:MBL fold metallo-hydrolase [Lysobacter enzymogenes]|uniref:Metallo-beta-lactamase superfamily protein n=1 Tax=Lysobacter enzymogenes TaxID=69 RepID=A0A0S2DCS7_LYSEN|nr:MBL fold metallo-hydrolase [Lysobacter enzymogenes]ALN56316.1 metallo-beta-lactamase superfamily protein [Lysobacter enzymogenes]QQQ00327.1 MBL fold metallo-hydrolase [Lysobacter enzymogenes]